MTRPRTTKRIAAYCLLLGLLLLIGKPLWTTLVIKLAGGQTVQEVLQDLDGTMAARFPNIDRLTDGNAITLIALKEERLLECWKSDGQSFHCFATYPFTGTSGIAGPKLKEGDLQIPEGVYRIDGLNPNSTFHLSLKVNYPNAFDKAMARQDQRTNLGGDIFIHGGSASIGCIPIGDNAIEELFYLIAKNGYRNTTVIIAPSDFRQSTSTPAIETIDWEDNLYRKIREAMLHYQPPE